MEAYGQLNEAAQSGSISTDDFNVHLQQLSATYNISILILDEDSETIRVSGGDPSMLRADLWSHIIFDAYDEAEAESFFRRAAVIPFTERKSAENYQSAGEK